MIKAPIPDNEKERLAELQQYGVLDTPPEQSFDDLTRLASHLLKTPIALVSIVDRDRQWFKSRVGLDAAETPRDVSFCGHAVANREMLVVPDASADLRFADNPLVMGDPRVKFYAGTPLITKNGHALGTLCVIDHKPREITEEEKELLRGIGRQVLAQLELRLRMEELTDALRKNREMVEKLEDSRKRATAVLNTAVDGIITINAHGIVDSINVSATRIFGYQAEEVIGRNISMLMPTPYSTEHDGYLENYLKTGLKKVIGIGREVTGRRKDGTTFPMELSVSEFMDGDRTMFTGIVRNITERKEFEAEILMARTIAEDANRSKSQFLANMSHELRTPLNAIIGFSEMLIEDGQETDNPETLDDLEKINTAGKHLLGLINDILDLSKVEAGKMELYSESFSLSELIEECLATVRPLVEKNSNRIILELKSGSKQMFSDTTKVRQVLFNLLSNAAKFTKEGEITLRIRDELKSGTEFVVIEVADTGIGMTPDQTVRLFQNFTQADASTTRKFGGTGLGLALSKKFCEMMGGFIDLVSEPGKGTTFMVWLPRRLSPAEEREEPASSDQPSRVKPAGNNLVLVVDDDRKMLELMGRTLTSEGYEVATASGGEEGLRLARLLKPSVIILDLLMPDLDGWNVISRLRSDPETAGIPVVIATVMDDRARGFEMGAFGFMIKPIKRKTLLEQMRRVAGKQGGTALVLEDDPASSRMMRESLEKEGWSVTLAVNGKMGLEALETIEPDVILLDLMMPEMDGFEFLATIRNREQMMGVPVIVISAKDLSREEKQTLEKNATMIIHKDSRSLTRVMERVIGSLPESVA